MGEILTRGEYALQGIEGHIADLKAMAEELPIGTPVRLTRQRSIIRHIDYMLENVAWIRDTLKQFAEDGDG